MSWSVIVVPMLAALALLILPGLVVALTARLRGFLAVAIAPLLSATVIGLGAIAAGLLHARWSVLVVAVSTAILALITAAVMAIVQHAVGPVPSGRSSKADGAVRFMAVAVAAVFLIRQLRNAFWTPDAISQTFDNIFHLNAIRYIVETGSGSSLTLGRMTSPDAATAFYPAAFHDVVSLVFASASGQIAVATNATVMAIAAVVWPLSCLALVFLALPDRRGTTLAAGVLTASFATFPLYLTDFGVLYPNLFGLSLLPAAIALLVQVLRVGAEQRLHPVHAALVLLAGLPGLALAHPNALMTLLAISVAAVVTWTTRAIRKTDGVQRPGWWPPVAALLFLAAFVPAWINLRPPAEGSLWEAPESVAQALGEGLLLTVPRGGQPAWVVGFLTILGIAYAVRHRLGWLVGSWATIFVLWLAVAGMEFGDLRSTLVGIWYNDPYRFSANLVIVAFPLAALGVQAIMEWLSAHWTPGSGPLKSENVRSATAGVLLAVLVALTTQFAPYMSDEIHGAGHAYARTPAAELLTTDEYELIKRLPADVPAEAVVATDPWNGSSMAYALTGVKTTTTHVFYTNTPDLIAIQDHLDEGRTGGACPAVKDLHVGYVLDFGRQEIHGGDHPYPGFDRLAHAKGFERVDSEGTAALYRVTACS